MRIVFDQYFSGYLPIYRNPGYEEIQVLEKVSASYHSFSFEMTGKDPFSEIIEVPTYRVSLELLEKIIYNIAGHNDSEDSLIIIVKKKVDDVEQNYEWGLVIMKKQGKFIVNKQE